MCGRTCGLREIIFDSCPPSSIIHLNYPRKDGKGNIKDLLSWHDGGLLPERPDESIARGSVRQLGWWRFVYWHERKALMRSLWRQSKTASYPTDERKRNAQANDQKRVPGGLLYTMGECLHCRLWEGWNKLSVWICGSFHRKYLNGQPGNKKLDDAQSHTQRMGGYNISAERNYCGTRRTWRLQTLMKPINL